MTVASDFAAGDSVRPALFLRIGGFEPQIWSIPDPPQSPTSGWTRSAISGLIPPTEHTEDFDLRTLEPQGSAITFELQEFPDPSDESLYYWAQEFAPGKQSLATTYTSYLSRDNENDSYLVPASTPSTIPMRNNADAASNFPSSGAAWLGGQRIGYTAKGTTTDFNGVTIATLLNCTMGEYHALIDPRDTGSSTDFFRPISYDHSHGRGIALSTESYSWIGRDVALYVTTWDEATGTWNTESNAKLLWYGYISGGVKWDPLTARWRVSAESVGATLERDVLRDQALQTPVAINMTGAAGRTFRIKFSLSNAQYAEAEVTVAASFYNPKRFVTAVNDQLGSGKFTYTGGSFNPGLQVRMVDGKANLYVWSTSDPLQVEFTWSDSNGNPCHVAQVLGWGSADRTVMTYLESSTSSPALEGKKPIYAYYQPLASACNGNKLAVRQGHGYDGQRWIDTQGDYASNMAHVEVRGEGIFGDEYHGVMAYTAITARDANSSDATQGPYWEFTLADDYHQPDWTPELLKEASARDQYFRAFVGSPEAIVPGGARQVFCHKLIQADGTERGPFRMLLDLLTSTGAGTSYNGTYDTMHEILGIAVPSQVIDDQSFLDADAYLAAVAPTAWRRASYVIREPTPWLELAMRECKLAGAVLRWTGEGKIGVALPFNYDFSNPAATLSNSTKAQDDDYPLVDIAPDSVVNQYKVECNYDRHLDEYRKNITLNDVQSQDVVVAKSTMKLKHPGLRVPTGAELAEVLLNGNRAAALSLPQQRARFTLNSTLVGVLGVGDFVVVDFDAMHPDPYGTGAMSVSSWGIVLGLGWDYSDWTGFADVLIVAIEAKTPWAPSTLVDITATNGGWDAGTYDLTTVARHYGRGTDSLDAAAFAAGDVCLVHERACVTPGSPATGPWTVTIDSIASNVITMQAVTLTGWSATTEYVLVPADWSAVTASQKTRGLWAAEESTELLNSTDAAQRWG